MLGAKKIQRHDLRNGQAEYFGDNLPFVLDRVDCGAGICFSHRDNRVGIFYGSNTQKKAAYLQARWFVEGLINCPASEIIAVPDKIHPEIKRKQKDGFGALNRFSSNPSIVSDLIKFLKEQEELHMFMTSRYDGQVPSGYSPDVLTISSSSPNSDWYQPVSAIDLVFDYSRVQARVGKLTPRKDVTRPIQRYRIRQSLEQDALVHT